MGLAVLVGWWIGQWLDGKLGTEPYLMLLFLGCGIAAAFKGLIRTARQTKRAVAESDEAGGAHAGLARSQGVASRDAAAPADARNSGEGT